MSEKEKGKRYKSGEAAIRLHDYSI